MKLKRHVPTDKIWISRGRHRSPDEGLCLMEMVAYAVDEPHSDHPKCVDYLLGAVARWVNDNASDSERQGLFSYIPRLIGTRYDRKHAARLRLLRELSCRYHRNELSTMVACAGRRDPLGLLDRLIMDRPKLSLNPVLRKQTTVADESRPRTGALVFAR